MSFSEESIRKLADVTSNDIFEAICDSGRLDEVVMNEMPYAIREVMGEVSPSLVGELGCEVMGRIGVISKDDSIWRSRYEALYRYVKQNFAESYVDGAEYMLESNQFREVN